MRDNGSMNTQTSADLAQQEIAEEFAYFGDWTERYQYLIDLGKQLPPFPEEHKTEAYRVLVERGPAPPDEPDPDPEPDPELDEEPEAALAPPPDAARMKTRPMAEGSSWNVWFVSRMTSKSEDCV